MGKPKTMEGRGRWEDGIRGWGYVAQRKPLCALLSKSHAFYCLLFTLILFVSLFSLAESHTAVTSDLVGSLQETST
eukprot:scaffold110929_cov15-Tisochrysis_lutea.AAC.1